MIRYGSINSKKGNRLFYKGKGGLKPGIHTKFGYKIQDDRRREYVVPDLKDFKLTPYVSKVTDLE